MLVLLVAPGTTHGVILDTLRAIEERYRRSVETHSRSQNIDILDDQDGEEESLAVCNLIEMNRYFVISSDPGQTRSQDLFLFPQRALAAIALAMEHLNTGNGSIIPEIGGLNATCNIRFVAEFIDTAGDVRATLLPLNEILSRDVYQPCAFIGAFTSACL